MRTMKSAAIADFDRSTKLVSLAARRISLECLKQSLGVADCRVVGLVERLRRPNRVVVEVVRLKAETMMNYLDFLRVRLWIELLVGL